MRTVRCCFLISFAIVLSVMLAVSSPLFAAGVPRGWYLAGSKPSDYEAGIDPQAGYNGYPSAYLRAKMPIAAGFGTLMQDFRADKYLGKRVRLSAFVKADGVGGWAALWVRVDKGSESVAFDNMQDRPIKGTTEWKNYQVVLDVPADASGVFFGVLLGGSGTVWLNNVKFDIVGPDVPVTSKPAVHRPDSPTNLDFRE